MIERLKHWFLEDAAPCIVRGITAAVIGLTVVVGTMAVLAATAHVARMVLGL